MFRIRFKQIFYLPCLLLLIGCSDPRLDQLSPGATILAFGDSLTVGVGASPEKNYPSVLSELSGRKVVNGGVSGETTGEGLRRLPSLLDKHDPELLILLEGGNDILRNQPFDNVRNNLSAMINLAEQQGIPVVLLGVPEKSLFSSSAPFYAELADEHGLVFDGNLVGGLLRTTKYKSDPIHLNAAGYRVMAEEIHALLQENGAL